MEEDGEMLRTEFSLDFVLGFIVITIVLFVCLFVGGDVTPTPDYQELVKILLPPKHLDYISASHSQASFLTSGVLR